MQYAINAARAEQRRRTNIAVRKYNKRESEFELDEKIPSASAISTEFFDAKDNDNELFYFGSMDEKKEHETVNDLKVSIAQNL